MAGTIWRENKEEKKRLDIYNKAYNQMDDFYNTIKNQNKKNIIINGVKVSHRKNQEFFSRKILRTIRDKDILLVEAGVGIGKSMGYLIPIFTYYNNSEQFNTIIISTSTIALQQQLLIDIDKVSKLLGIKIKPIIIKGINNYACYDKIEKSIYHEDTETMKILESIKKEIEKKQTVDRDELQEVSEKIWNQIKIDNRGKCSKCIYSDSCLYKQEAKKIKDSNIIITNHNYLAKSAVDKRELLDYADMIVFDEAHKLEEAIREINTGTIDLKRAINIINYYINNYFNDKKNIEKYAIATIQMLSSIFSKIRSNSSKYYNENQEDKSIGITECDKLPFEIKSMESDIKKAIKYLNKTIQAIEMLPIKTNFKYVEYLESIKNLLNDMITKEESDKIYWSHYYKDNKIKIKYTCKETKDVTKEICDRTIPIIFTSGTMLDSNSTYNNFKRGLSISEINLENHTVIDEKPYKTPYNFNKNSLFYYDNTISNPKLNYEKYLDELVDKVIESIKITNGRTLILFTSKKVMNYVYEQIMQYNFDFPMYIQSDYNSKIIKNSFSKNSKSCLFGTGTFWEGIDIKGKSLSSVIITRLPFDNVDAISIEKSKDNKGYYVENMLRNLVQGTGRLIRGSNDKGVVICLDSRIDNYIDKVKRITPFTNFTTNIEDVKAFSNKYITNLDGPRGPYKKRIKK